MRLIILPIALLATACAMPVGENLAGPPPGACPPGHGGDCRDGPPPQAEANADRNERLQAAQQSAALMAITGAVISMAANGGHPGYGQQTPAYWPGHPAPLPPPPKPACEPMTPSAHCPGM